MEDRRWTQFQNKHSTTIIWALQIYCSLQRQQLSSGDHFRIMEFFAWLKTEYRP